MPSLLCAREQFAQAQAPCLGDRLELVLDELALSQKGVRLRRIPDRLQHLLAHAAGFLNEAQQRDARRIKEIGDRANHGEPADAAAAREALVKLRRLIQATFK